MSASVAAPKFPKQGHTWVPLPRGQKGNRLQAHAVQTIHATPEQVFNVYTRLEMLQTWQQGVISAVKTGGKMSHWKMEDVGTGKQFEFDAEEVESVRGQRHISRVTTGPLKGTTETLTLEPHPSGRGTVATLVSDYTLPGGWFTNATAAVFSRKPEQVTIENLRLLKELIESGEIATVTGQPAGRRGISGKLKQFMLGENMPVPPGTSDRARKGDLPKSGGSKLGTTLAVAGAVGVLGVLLWIETREDS